MDYWRALFEELMQPSTANKVQALTIAEATDVLQARDEEDYLSLCELPYYLCLTTIVLYGPERDNLAGFVLYYQENGKIGPVEMPERYLGGWRQYYADVTMGRSAQERVPFRRFRSIFCME